jgi:class 3 adenylate cyclase/tetratricopeptide (TPR) repeat protein
VDIAAWLRGLGLQRYEAAFRENEIDRDVLPELGEGDLEKIGIPLGPRKLLLKAIRALDTGACVGQVTPPVPVAGPREDTAERRQLTVMFCDLVGSTALSAALDPEDLRGIIGTYHRCCTELVERNGGFVAKYMGDGVLAYFGYPRAHEHDAERAVRAGLNLVEAVPKLETHARSPLQVRVGIATGLVVVGDLIGSGAAQEQAVVGETPNLAARLQALAEPGAVVIASSTQRLTGGLFEYRDLGTVSLKGFAENVRAWQVLGAGTAESRFEALRATTTPLVGREEEIELLMRRWEQAKQGEGRVVLVSGEPGIGKSRIAQTVVDRISSEPHTRLRYFCSPHHQDSAHYPSIAQLERAAGFRREDTADQRLVKLEAVLAQGANDLSEVVPFLADLLSVPTAERYPPLSLTPQKRKERTLHAQLAQVEGLAAQQPVLMVWEDIHWSDPTTRESLDLLVDRVPTLRVLVIITFRPEFAPPWVGRPHVTMLTLNRLPPRQRAEMIASVIGAKTLPKDISDQIIDRTDGVPLFIEELTKSVLESGLLTEAGDRYVGSAAPLAIPTTLHASLLARLDRLAPTRELAQIGAALGRSFSHELIGAVAKMPAPQLNDALAQLVDAELIFRRGTPPDAEYTFKHALVQDAAYSTLLRSRRQQVHGRIAAVLEHQFTEIREGQPEILAHHCAEAGLPGKAITYRLKAGQQAMARSAMTEAVAQLRRGLELLSGLPDDVVRRQHELDLQIALGGASIATEGYAATSVAAAYARAEELCSQLDRPEQLVPVFYGQVSHHVLRAELSLAKQKAEQLLKMGEIRNDPVMTFVAHNISAAALFHLGDFQGTLDCCNAALRLSDAFDHDLYAKFSSDNPLIIRIRLFRALFYLGHLERGRVERERAGIEAAQRGHAHTLAHFLGFGIGCDWLIQAEPAAVLQRAEKLAALSAEHGFAFWSAAAAGHRAQCLSMLGRVEEGLSARIEALAAYRETGSLVSLPHWLAGLADAYARTGRVAEAVRQIDEAVRLGEATEEGWSKSEVHRVRGQVLLAAGDPMAAEASLGQAVAVARGQSARVYELRAATSLARLWRDQGKLTEARDLLAPIYGWFTEGFDTPVLKDAKALLDELAS